MRSVAVAAGFSLLLAACGSAAGQQLLETRSSADVVGPPAEERPAVDQPNIVVLLTDDQTVEQMRALEETRRRVFDGGTEFVNSFVTYPTCCPSRATLLTGQYAHNHDVRWNAPPTGGFQNFQDQETALPVALTNAGYSTIHLGKYLNGYGFFQEDRFTPPGWTDFKALVSPSDGQYFDFTVWDNGAMVTPEGYLTDVMTEFAVEAIERESASGKPIFLHMAYTAPHGAFGFPLGEKELAAVAEELEPTEGDLEIKSPVPAPRHEGTLRDEQLPRPASLNEDAMDDKPRHVRGKRALTDDDIEEIERNYIAELESLLAVDESVVRILDTLERLDELDDTVVMFTSDNGFFHGEHRLPFSKYLPYEESIRVPLAMAGPGVPVGASVETLVSNVDLAATILDLASAESLRPLDGRSLVPLLEEPEDRWDRVIYLEGTAPEGPFRPQYRGIRSPRWVYVEYSHGGRELYDLQRDPFQLSNLANDPESQAVAAGYAALLDVYGRCAGSECNEIGDIDGS